jgi:hypothetical protein
MDPVVLPDCKLRCDIALIKQHVDKSHLLFHGAHLTVNSVRCHQVSSKMGETSPGKRVPTTLEGGPCGQAYGG